MATLDQAGTDDLIGWIYEAGAFPERWPHLLQRTAETLGARGGNLIRRTALDLHMVSSPATEEVTHEFIRLGHNAHNTRVSRLLGRGHYAGFLADSHLHSEEELETLPMFADFLNPRGVAAGAGTLIQGSKHDGLIIAIEAFADHPASRSAVATLDLLRPHLARAAVLSAEVQSARARTIADAFEQVGSAIALLDETGACVTATRQFETAAAELISDGPGRLRMIDPQCDQRFAQAIAQLARSQKGTSLALRNRDRLGVAALHLIPARREARDVFDRVTGFAVIAGARNDILPGADIIAALFDLTPAEARVARGIAAGRTPADLARDANLSTETIRSQLKRVFAKTSTRRQAELSMLIAALS